MSVLEKATTGKQARRRKITIYGGQGDGKSTIASKFPKSIFLATEDGTANIDCTRVTLESAIETLQAANECANSEFDTIVLDSADWFEKLIEQALREENFKTDYGKGAIEIDRRFGKLLEQFDACIEAGKTVVVICHQEIRKAEDVAGNTWDQIKPKLSKRVCERLLEWSDIVLHMKREDFIRTEEGEFGRKKGIATTTGRRILCSESHPSFVAKTRYELPAVMDASDDEVITLLKGN